MTEVHKLSPTEYKHVDVQSFGDKISQKVRELTPSGRMEKYKNRYKEVLDQATGAERYMLMEKIDADAKKYAWRTFTRDVVVASVSIGTLVYGFKRFKDSGYDIKGAANLVKGDFKIVGEYPKKAWGKVNDATQQLGKSFAKGAGDEATKHVSAMAETISQTLRGSDGTIQTVAVAMADGRKAAEAAQAATANALKITSDLPAIKDTVASIAEIAKSGADHIVNVTSQSLQNIENVMADAKIVIAGGQGIVDAVPSTVEVVQNAVIGLNPTLSLVVQGMDAFKKGAASAENVLRLVPNATTGATQIIEQLHPLLNKGNLIASNGVLIAHSADRTVARVEGFDFSAAAIMRAFLRKNKKI